MNDTTQASAPQKPGAMAEIVEIVKTIVCALGIALFLRVLFFQPYTIPSASMEPNLYEGDYIIVSKWTYGYSKYSIPFAPSLFPGRIAEQKAHRGDIVVFALPHDPHIDYIKRIIGLPGDRIQMRGGQLYINGAIVPREPAGNYVAEGDGTQMMLKRYIETLPNGVKHPILKASDDGPLDNTQEYKVPDGNVFAMGDNRDNSLDSRVLTAVGFVPIENLVGRAEFLFFSADGQYPIWQVWQWPFEIRWSRLFTGVR